MICDHPTTILLSVHKGASTFLTQDFVPALQRVFPGMEHMAYHHELLQGRKRRELTLPPTGIVASRVYPPHYDMIIEDPVPAGGRFADKKLLMLRRDPRDVAVSFYYSFAYSHAPPPGNGRASRKFESRRQAIQKMDVPRGIVKYTAKSAIKQFLATVDFLERYPQTCLTTYEQLTTDFSAWLERVRDYMGWTVAQAAAVGEGLEASVQPPEKEDPYQHKRRVRPGNWKEAFTPPLRRLFEKKLGHHLAEGGYEW